MFFLLVSYGIYEKSHGALFVVWMFFVEIKKYLAMQELSQAIVPKVYPYDFLKCCDTLICIA